MFDKKKNWLKIGWAKKYFAKKNKEWMERFGRKRAGIKYLG